MDRAARLLFAMGPTDDGPQPGDYTKHMPDSRGRWRYIYDAENSREGREAWRVVPATSPAVDDGQGTLRRRQFHYDPSRTGLLNDEFEGQILRRYPSARTTQFVDPSTTDHRNERLDYIDTPPGMLWRGMSADEYEEAKTRGYFESRGDHNIGDYQVGKTFFTTRPSSAENYANGFAPWQYKPTFDRPAYVVGIPDRPDVPRGPLGDDPSSHEVGLEGRIPFSEIQKTYVGHPHAIDEGKLDLIKEPWEPEYGTPMVNHPSSSVRWEDLTPDVPRVAALLFADIAEVVGGVGDDAPPTANPAAPEDLLRDPRSVPPGYFTGIHEMGHGLDFAGDWSSGRAYDVAEPIYRNQFPDRKSPWGPGDPQFQEWVRTQLPRAAFENGGADGKWYLNSPEARAHAFTEVRLNPQANELSRALSDSLVKSQQGRDEHGPLSVGPGVPDSFLDAIADVQADHPAADVNRIDLMQDDSNGPAYMEGPGPHEKPPYRDQPPRMRIDQQYIDQSDPKKFQNWFDNAIDQGYYPRWQSTTGLEPWPEDAIEDMATEFDQPKVAALLFGSIFPPHDEAPYVPSGEPPREAPEGAKWYHVTRTPMQPGEKLRPFGGERPYGKSYDSIPQFKHRDQHVWMEPNAQAVQDVWSSGDAKYIYEVEPHETPQPWNGTGTNGWVADGATVKRQISDNGWLPQNFTASVSRETSDVFADPDGTGVWRTAVDQRTGTEVVEFLAAPHLTPLSVAAPRR